MTTTSCYIGYRPSPHRNFRISLWCGRAVVAAFAVLLPIAGGGQETANLVEELAPSTVIITALDAKNTPIRQGSGVIASEDGKVVTNFHVVTGAATLHVRYANGTATVVASLTDYDLTNDIAVFKIPLRGLPWVRPKYQASVRAGDAVLSITNPFGLERSVSTGVVSGIREFADQQKLIQVSAAVSPGSSGGPVFSMDGKLIGIVAGSLTGGQNLNFVIPCDLIIPLVLSSGDISLARISVLGLDKPADAAPSSIAATRSFLMDGVWQGTFSDSLINGHLTITLSQDSQGRVAGTYTASTGGGGTMRGQVFADHVEFELTQNIQGCPGVFKAVSGFLGDSMAGEYSGNDCLGFHPNGQFVMARMTD
jgi:S1-C subfamily serine protease